MTGPRFTRPAELVRGRAVQVAPQLLDEDGGTVAPTSWSAKLWRDGVLVTSTSGTTSLSWQITAGATWDLGANYQTEWYIAWSGGSTTVQNPALVCHSVLEPMVRPNDIYLLQPALNPDAPAPIVVLAEGTTIADILADTWEELLHELRQRGLRADRILNGYDFKQPHTWLTVARLMESAAGSVGDTGLQWATQAQVYRDRYDKWWTKAVFTMAESTSQANKKSAVPPLVIGGTFNIERAPWDRRGAY